MRILNIRILPFICLALVVWGLGCSSDFSDKKRQDAAGDVQSDAGTSGCTLHLITPPNTFLNEEMELLVEVVPANFLGQREFTWSVKFQGGAQDLMSLSDPADRVSLVPMLAGSYEVEVNAVIGTERCQSTVGSFNVFEDGANVVEYRMRVVPASGAPMQDFVVSVHGGSDLTLPARSLKTGQVVSGRIVDAEGQGVAGYLRARQLGVSVQTDFETFADENGNYSFRLPDTSFDFLIVPSGDGLPAVMKRNVSRAALSENINLETPLPIFGHIFAANGNPVAGALVSLMIDGAPSTSSRSDEQGAFRVQGRAGALEGLAVAPAEGSGMPVLRSTHLSGQRVVAASDLIIRYTAPIVRGEVDVRLSNGMPASSAKIEWRAVLANAATLRVTSLEVIAGDLRVLATSDSLGHAEANLTGTIADLIVSSVQTLEGKIVKAHSWGDSPRLSLDLAAPSLLPLVIRHQDTTVALAKVSATPLGHLSPQLPTFEGKSSAAGLVGIPTLRGGQYRLDVTSSEQGTSSLMLLSDSSTPSARHIELPGSVIASGTILLNGQGASGAQIRLFCMSCIDLETPQASAHTSSSGQFSMRVNDPGVSGE